MPHVLIVDDEPAILELVLDALNQRGLEVRAAQTDQEALELLEREAQRLSVLVTDINLGKGVTGFDIARKARELNPQVKVVYVTGQPQRLDKFRVDGALLVEKPFAPDTLAEKVVALVAPTGGD